MRVARDLQERTLSARTGKEAAELAEAFADVVEDVLKSIALEARLVRESREGAIASPKPLALKTEEPAEIVPAGPEKIIKH